jgi:hypothetical protein
MATDNLDEAEIFSLASHGQLFLFAGARYTKLLDNVESIRRGLSRHKFQAPYASKHFVLFSWAGRIIEMAVNY